MKEFNENIVINELNRVYGIHIDNNVKVISILKDADNIGKSIWSKITYLCNHRGYTIAKVDKIISNAKKKERKEKVRKEKHNSNKGSFKVNLVKTLDL